MLVVRGCWWTVETCSAVANTPPPQLQCFFFFSLFVVVNPPSKLPRKQGSNSNCHISFSSDRRLHCFHLERLAFFPSLLKDLCPVVSWYNSRLAEEQLDIQSCFAVERYRLFMLYADTQLPAPLHIRWLIHFAFKHQENKVRSALWLLDKQNHYIYLQYCLILSLIIAIRKKMRFVSKNQWSHYIDRLAWFRLKFLFFPRVPCWRCCGC